ncbi:MAG: zf-HC2 domain-containing protein [Actinobacteria bacterium]|nr:zf-HC2 domain-containing protein [Actinomycetota bacterium]
MHPDEHHTPSLPGREPPPVVLGHIDEWESWAVDYLDGRLTGEALAAVETHLAGCSECGEALAAQQTILSLTRSAPSLDLPRALWPRVLAGLPRSTTPAAESTPRPTRRRPTSLRDRLFGGGGRLAWIPAVVVLIMVGAGLAAVRGLSPGGGSVTVSTGAPEIERDGGTGETKQNGSPTTQAVQSLQTAPAEGSGAGAPEGAATETSAGTLSPTGQSAGAADQSSGTTTTTAGASPAGEPAIVALTVTPRTAGAAPWPNVVERVTGLAPVSSRPAQPGPAYVALVDPDDLDRLLEVLKAGGLDVETMGNPTGLAAEPSAAGPPAAAPVAPTRLLIREAGGVFRSEPLPADKSAGTQGYLIVVITGPAG